jgi:hypothetical protein
MVGFEEKWLRRFRNRIFKPLLRGVQDHVGRWRNANPPGIPPLDPKLLDQVYERLREFAEELEELDRYYLAEGLSGTVYPKYKFSDFSRIYLEDEAFMAYYERFMDPGNYRTYDRKYFLNELLKLTTRVPGDFAECGSYKGVSAHLMCAHAERHDRTVHLFDSFEGLPEPEARDGGWWKKGDLAAGEAALKETLGEFTNWRAYPGWIPSRFSEVKDRSFSFVHIDVDLYQPTRDSIEFFYPRTSPGGVILLDDYGTWTCPGAKEALDQFFSTQTEEVILVPTGQGLVIREG